MGFVSESLKVFVHTKDTSVRADPDASIVAAVQEGDVSAFDTLVAKYRERLYSVIYNLTNNTADAADLTQETFIKAFKSIGRFRRNASFYTWLYRIGINTTFNHLKKFKNRRCFSLETLQHSARELEFVQQLSASKSADTSTILKELQVRLNEALQMLSDIHRTVVVLFEVEGFSHAQIAAIMGCSEGTVRSRLHYAKDQLRHILQDYVR